MTSSMPASVTAKVRDSWTSFSRTLRKSSKYGGSIFAYHEFNWPKSDELGKMEKHVLEGGNVTMENMPCENIEYNPTSYVLFKGIEAEGKTTTLNLEQYSRGMSVKVARRCRQINHSLQMRQPEWVAMIKISTLTDKIKSEEQKAKRLEEISLNNFGVLDRLEYEFLDLEILKDMSYSNIERPGGVDVFVAKLSAKLKLHVEQLKEDKEKLESKLFSILDQQFREGFSPGPVGDLPIHDCFLLDLTDIGLKVIEKYFNEPDKLSLPYTNDLSPWRRGPKKGEGLEWEDGLYTGETVLHIAIVKENLKVAEKLLSKGIALSSRARGVFFQPKWVRPRVGSLSIWQRFKAWVGGMDLTNDKFAALEEYLNPDSVRCNAICYSCNHFNSHPYSSTQTRCAATQYATAVIILGHTPSKKRILLKHQEL
jgi:hypothetical protein